MIKEKVKGFIGRLKIFGWYLITEPFRQAKELLRIFLNLLEALNKTRTWMYIALLASIIALYLNKKFFAGLFLMFLFFVILLWEWESGFFMKRYREKIRRNIEKELRESGEDKK